MHITQVVLILQTIGLLIASGKLLEAAELTNKQLAVAQAQEADYEAYLQAQMEASELDGCLALASSPKHNGSDFPALTSMGAPASALAPRFEYSGSSGWVRR